MSRLSRGLDSEDEDDGDGGRLSRVGEITVARSGKRIIVRKTAHSQIVELGRLVDKVYSVYKPSFSILVIY
jgi:hypothetical protein